MESIQRAHARSTNYYKSAFADYPSGERDHRITAYKTSSGDYSSFASSKNDTNILCRAFFTIIIMFSKFNHPVYCPQRLQWIFDRRAAAFNKVAFLPREIARRMRERLDYIKANPTHILDVGCGTGNDLKLLHKRFPKASVFGADLSYAMLAHAINRKTSNASWWHFLLLTTSLDKISKAFGSARGPHFAQADFSILPFAFGSFEFIWSNLALHWHSRPDLVLVEWQRVLKANGLLMFSTLGPNTFKELRSAWAEVEASCGIAMRPHVIDFVDMHNLGDMLIVNGFEIPVLDQETLTITYRSPELLLRDVRAWGAYPFQRDATTSTHVTRSLYNALYAAIAARRRVDNMIALTFEIIYGHAWKAAMPNSTAEDHKIVKITREY